MNENELKKLINKDKYQVFLFSCPAPIPLNFALHYWFVINSKGKISRWDLLWRNNLVRTSKEVYSEEFLKGKKFKALSKREGYVYQDILPPTKGVDKYQWKSRPLSKGSLMKTIGGEKGSIAHRMIQFIHKNSFKYTHRDYYKILGPNSNTFIQWIINHFPESGFKLSWRAIGKNYRIDNKK